MTGVCVVSLVSPLDVHHFGEHTTSVLSELRPEDQWITNFLGFTLTEQKLLEDELSEVIAGANVRTESVTILVSNARNAWTSVLDLVERDYVLTVQAEDTLVTGSLASIGSTIDLAGPCDLLYGDEVWVSSAGSAPDLLFKTAWGPYTNASLLHPRTRVVLSMKALRFASKEPLPVDWADVALKLSTAGRTIRHIPVTLVRQRGVTPPAEDTSETLGASDEATCLISIVVPSTGRPAYGSPTPMVVSLVKSIEATLSPGALAEYVIVCDEGFPEATAHRLHQQARHPVHLVDFRRAGDGFNFSLMVNRGALESKGDLLVFVNDDVEFLTQSWDQKIRGIASHASVGAVGVHLQFPDGSVQHLGVTTQLVDGGLPIHSNYARAAEIPGHRGMLRATREVMAVSGAFMAIERRKYLLVGGFSSIFPSDYNDIDMCFKLRTAGLFTIVTPLVTALHGESQTRSRKRHLDAEIALQSRWGRWTVHDPWRNPNVAHEDTSEKVDASDWSRGNPFLQSALVRRDPDLSPAAKGTSDFGGVSLQAWPSIRERRVLQWVAPRMA